MLALITLALLSSASAFPLDNFHFGRGGGGNLIHSSDFGPSSNDFGQLGGGYSGGECGPGEVRNTDGSCDTPLVNRKIFVFAAQNRPQAPIVAPVEAEPEVNIDVVFVKTPEEILNTQSIVAPATEQKTVVYVLSKRPTVEQQVIELPQQPQEPEVFFVNYNEGDNYSLPGGINLQDALNHAGSAQPSIIDASSGGHNNYA